MAEADTQSKSFKDLLDELAAELAKGHPTDRRPIQRQDRVRAGDLPVMGSPVEFPRNALSPESQKFIDTFGVDPDRNVTRQGLANFGSRVAHAIPGVTAGEFVGDALIDPSIPKVTNAGMQTAFALARPSAALKVLGGGYKDLGLLDPTPAEAQTLKPYQKRELEISEANPRRRGRR